MHIVHAAHAQSAERNVAKHSERSRLAGQPHADKQSLLTDSACTDARLTRKTP